MSSSYLNVVRGSLKLKNSSTCNASTARKRKRPSIETASEDVVEKHASLLEEVDPQVHSPEEKTSENESHNTADRNIADVNEQKSIRNHSAEEKNELQDRFLIDVVGPEEHLTPAETAFRLAQHKREKERTNKRLALTHRQKMEKFNAQLRTLPEHFDIPKVGPG